MMYVETLRNLPVPAINILRKLENVMRKIIKCKWSKVFNDTCLKENFLPNYINSFIINISFTLKVNGMQN